MIRPANEAAPGRIQAIGTFIYRMRWAILAGWALAVGLLVFVVSTADPSANEAEDFLPREAPSRRAVEAFRKHFPNGSELSKAVVVFERRGGKMTPADYDAIEAVAERIPRPVTEHVTAADLAGLSVRSPRSIPMNPSPLRPAADANGQAALIVVNIPSNFITLRSSRTVDHIRAILDGSLPAGLEAAITGSSGFGHDYALAAKRSHDNTVLVTLSAVICILLVVYRAPGAAMIPLAAIGMAAVVADRVLALCTLIGLHVGTGEQIFVVVLLYGAGIDYSLMLISRYREFLDDGVPGPRAVATALNATAPAIFASAGTDTVGLLMLSFATYGVFRSTGPAVAIALCCALTAAITLVPALMGIAGRRMFWPSRQMGQIGMKHLWPAVARAVTARPGLVLVAALAALAVPAVRGANITWVYDALTGLKGDYHATKGAEMVTRHWPGGEITPVSVLVHVTSGVEMTTDEWRTHSRHVTSELMADEQLAADDVRSFTQPLGKDYAAMTGAAALARRFLGRQDMARDEYLSEDLWAMRLEIVLTDPGFSLAAMDAAQRARQVIRQVLGRADRTCRVYLAGITASTLDVRRITQSDFYRIAALVLGVIFVMILILLRDLILSAFMVASTLLSYLATLGICYWIFTGLFGAAGLDWKVEISLFVVMVAVGQDYNIYLAARLAQEARHFDLRQATRRAIVRTGPVISSCGVIMAATLGSLVAGDITLLQQLGVALSLGMLIDTFLVRPLILPAFAVLTGHTGRIGRTPGQRRGR